MRLFPVSALVVNSDARAIPLCGGSVQCVVTSPPYWGLRDYGNEGQLGMEPTPDEYVANMVEVFREVWRVLKDDGVLWLNLGDCYNGSGRASGRCWEEGNIPGLSKKQGTNAGSLVGKMPLAPGLKPKDLVGIPWRVAFALQADGWYLRSDIVWSKNNPMPESVTDRPTRAHEYVFLMAKNSRYFYDHEAIKEEQITPLDTKTAPSFGAAGGKAEDVYGQKVSGNKWEPSGKRNKRTVWQIPTQPYPEAHFATFPEKLAEPCIKAGSRLNDLVFDPFGGSGTTAATALKLGRRAIICDIGYHDLAMRRVVA